MNIEKVSILLKQVQFGKIVLAVILVNVLLLTFLVQPRRNSIADSQRAYGLLRQQAAGDQKEIRNLKNRVELLQRAQEDLKKIYSEILMSRKQGVLAIRLEVEDLTRSLQVRKENVSYSYKELPDFRLQQFGLSVPVEGSYRNIRKFINSIERSKHFLILERVDLSSEKRTDELNLDFQISTYLVEDEER